MRGCPNETCPNGNAKSRPLGAGGDGSSYPGERPSPVPAGLSTVPPDCHSGASPSLECWQAGRCSGTEWGCGVCMCVGVHVCGCVGVWVLLCKPAGTIIAYFTFMPRPVFINK